MDIMTPRIGPDAACELPSLALGDAPGSSSPAADAANNQAFPGGLHIVLGDGVAKHQMAQEAMASRLHAETTPWGGPDTFLQSKPTSVDADFSLHGESPLKCEIQGVSRYAAGAEVGTQENYIQSCLVSGLMNALDMARNAMPGSGGDVSSVVAKVSGKAAEYATSLFLEELAPSLGKDTWDELAIILVSVTESTAALSYKSVQKWIDILNNIVIRKTIEDIFPEISEAVANDMSKTSLATISDSSYCRMKSVSQGFQVALKNLSVFFLDMAEVDMPRFWKRAISGAYVSVMSCDEMEPNRQTIKFMSIGARALTAEALRMAVPGLGKYAAADLGVTLFPMMESAVVKLSNALVDVAFELLLSTANLELGFEDAAAHGEYA